MLPWTSVLLWISAGFLSLPYMSEPCQGNDFPTICGFVYRNVCFEFVEDSKTWSQARDSCENQGGKLLKVMNSHIKNVLKNVSIEGNSNFTWWLGEEVQEEPAISE